MCSASFLVQVAEKASETAVPETMNGYVEYRRFWSIFAFSHVNEVVAVLCSRSRAGRVRTKPLEFWMGDRLVHAKDTYNRTYIEYVMYPYSIA